VVVSAEFELDDADEALPAELRRLSADAALLAVLPKALMVIDGLPKSLRSKNTVWLTSGCLATGVLRLDTGAQPKRDCGETCRGVR
jgi:hypothetical protein